jgi:hypothetical protein
LPSVDALYQELGPRGLDVLLASFREDPGLVKRTVRERGYAAPVLLDRSTIRPRALIRELLEAR